MAINVSINKEGNITLYGNSEFCVSTDTISWEELILKDIDTEVICYGILSDECRGVSSYKDKEWQPKGKRATYRVYSKEKQQWDKNTSKYITVPVDKDEALLYSILKTKAKEFDGTILAGNITPWVNPFIYELDATESVNLSMIQKLSGQLAVLTLHSEPHELTQDEINAALESTVFTKKGTYTKLETETERLQSRYTFFEAQLKDVFEFTSLYDLAGQIEAIKANESSISPALKVENSINLTLELLKTIMGGR